MPSQKTRALFLEHQRKDLRRNEGNRTYIAEWNRKSTPQRADWVENFNLVNRRLQERDELIPDWDASRRAYERLRDQRSVYLQGYHEAVMEALKRATALREANVALRNQYRTFQALEAAQPVPSNVGQVWSQTWDQNCATNINALDAAITGLEGAKSGPHITPDPSGRR